MESTFLDITRLPELTPRNHLNPGGAWLLPGVESKSEPPRAVPACAFRFANEVLSFPADYKQQEVLSSNSPRVVVCCTRQWGKSTLGAIKALHHALLYPGSLILIASRTLPQAGELLQKALAFAHELGLPRRRAPGYPESLLLPNGSRIIAIPGRPDSTRGFSALSLLIVDEAAFVPDSLYQALRPMLATRRDGVIWLLSTPNGRKGFFFDEWTSDNPAWCKFATTAPECERIDDAFLEEERRLLGPVAFAREYMCEFNASGESFFEMDALEAATEPHSLAGMQYAGPPSARYYVGFDLGQRSSYSALVVIERVEVTTIERDPATFAFKKETHFHLRKIEQFPLNMTYDDTARKLKALIHSLPRSAITLMVDATGVGQPFLDILRKHNLGVHIMAIAITSGGGLTFSSGIQRVPKRQLMQAANYLMTADCFRIEPGLLNYTLLKREMDAYRVRTSGSGHQTFITSSTDDLVMAFALAAWQARKFLPKPA